MSHKIRVAIHGAAGRMGQRLIALGSADPELQIVAALEWAKHPKFGQDAGEIAGVGKLGLPLTDKLPEEVDAVIDFSVPAACKSIVDRCVQRGIPLVVATTGLEAEQKHAVQVAAEKIPLVWSPSMSTAVNLTMKLTEIAAKALRSQASGVDVEILERHHRFKEDAPSGTALEFGEIVVGAMGQTEKVYGREGQTGKRPQQQIAFHAVRTGDNPGEHTIIFGMLGETIELTVRASNRDCYALGALSATKFVVGKPAKLYGMADVLGL